MQTDQRYDGWQQAKRYDFVFMNVTTGKACLFMKSDKNNSDNLEILQLEGCFPDYPNLLSEVSDFADTIC